MSSAASARGACSVEGVHDAVASVECVGASCNPVSHNDGVEQGPEHNVDVADAHAPDVEQPAENPGGSEYAFNLCLRKMGIRDQRFELTILSLSQLSK